jgi:hypothetical protein
MLAKFKPTERKKGRQLKNFVPISVDTAVIATILRRLTKRIKQWFNNALRSTFVTSSASPHIADN